MRLAPHDCRHDPGVGHHAHPASLQAGLRPTSYCPCPLSPSNVRLGCLSLRRHAWARRRRARRDGVSHPSARLQSHLKSASRAAFTPGHPCALPSPILRRLSSTSQRHAAPCSAGLRGALARQPRRSGRHVRAVRTVGRPVGEAGAGATGGAAPKDRLNFLLCCRCCQAPFCIFFLLHSLSAASPRPEPSGGFG
jgi:hypothetical protein